MKRLSRNKDIPYKINIFFISLIRFYLINNNNFIETDNNKLIKKYQLKKIPKDFIIYYAKKHKLISIFGNNKNISEVFKLIGINLKEYCREEYYKTFLQLKILLKIDNIFKENHIKYLLIKGIPLSMQTTNSLFKRGNNYDIDIWIEEKDLEKSVKNLINSGFKISQNNKIFLLKNNIGKYSRFSKNELSMSMQTNNEIIYIDLHWRGSLIRYPLPNFKTAYESSTEIKLKDHKINTLNNKHTFILLCMHSAIDNWMCLRDLVDLQRLTQNLKRNELQKLNRSKIVNKSCKISYWVTKDSCLENNLQNKSIKKIFIKYSSINQIIAWRTYGSRNRAFNEKIKLIFFRLSLCEKPKDLISNFLYFILPPENILKEANRSNLSLKMIIRNRLTNIFARFNKTF